MIESEVKKLEKDYKAFMGIDSFPHYTFESKSVSLEKADDEGFDSVAHTMYKPEQFISGIEFKQTQIPCIFVRGTQK